MLHCRGILVEYVYGDRFWLSITGVTSVPSRVRRLCLLHQKETRRAVTLLCDYGDAASVRVVADYRVVVIPKNVGGRLWTLQDDAREINGATSIDEQIRRTQNLSFWLDYI